MVVFSYRGGEELPGAVESLLGQDEPLEIVVVHSGGGPAPAQLRERFPELPVLAFPSRLPPGAARNVGVAATRAPFVAFLEGDNRAAPGWASGRLRRHRAGAAAVACAKLPLRGGAAAWAGCLLQHSYRLPHHVPSPSARHGLSFVRGALERYGPFPERVRLGEDTALTRRLLAGGIEVEWAPEVVTFSDYPQTVSGLLLDQLRRGALRAREHGPRRGRRALLSAVRRAYEQAEGARQHRRRFGPPDGSPPRTSGPLLKAGAVATLAGTALAPPALTPHVRRLAARNGRQRGAASPPARR